MNLTQLLDNPDLSPPQLFNTPGILGQLKQKISTFIQFCKNNEQFTKIMITLGIKTPMYKHSNNQMKKIAHVATDILTCDSDIIAQLFIQDIIGQRIRCYSQSEDQVMEQIVSNQQTGQLVIADRTPSKQQKQQKQTQIQIFNKKYKYLLDLLSYFSQVQIDQNCLNYLSKILNTIIRVKPQQFFTFFIEQPQILKHMIQLTNYPSISYTIVKMINEGDDKKYRDFKLQVVEMVIKQILGKISNKQFGQYIQFIQQVFQKNRHRGDQKDQIKIVTQPLVNKSVIQSIVNNVLKLNNNPIQITNSILYLLKVVDRMNIDQQQDPYSYSQPSQPTPTMDFQVSQLFSSQTINKLLAIAQKITRQNYTSNQILNYYDLLLSISKNSRWKIIVVDKIIAILGLLKVMNDGERKFNGIIKNKIVSLIQIIYNKQQTVQQNNTSTNTTSDISTTTSTTTTTTSNLVPPLKSKITQQQSQLLHTQIQKLSQDNKQGICYKQKLSLILTPNLHGKQTQSTQNILNIVHSKYSNTLAPTNYTQNRSIKVKQLQFVKIHTMNKNKQKQKLQRQQKQRNKQADNNNNNSNNNDNGNINGNSQQNSNQMMEEHVIVQDVVNLSNISNVNQNASTSSSNQINISLLNDKIKSLKIKKNQQKTQQQSNININKKQNQQIIKVSQNQQPNHIQPNQKSNHIQSNQKQAQSQKSNHIQKQTQLKDKQTQNTQINGNTNTNNNNKNNNNNNNKQNHNNTNNNTNTTSNNNNNNNNNKNNSNSNTNVQNGNKKIQQNQVQQKISSSSQINIKKQNKQQFVHYYVKHLILF